MFLVRLGDPETRGIFSHAFSNHFFVSKAALDGRRCPDPVTVKREDAVEVLATASAEAAAGSYAAASHGDDTPWLAVIKGFRDCATRDAIQSSTSWANQPTERSVS